VVANAMVEEEVPAFIPSAVKQKIEKYKVPLNDAAGDVVSELHKSNVDLEQVLKAIDENSDKEFYAAIDELNSAELKNSDQAFDILKKHFKTDFDMELLRNAFTKNVDVKTIRKNLKQINEYRDQQLMDPEVAKEVIKKVLIEKEEEFKKATTN
jgi:hypothetical protein